MTKTLGQLRVIKSVADTAGVKTAVFGGAIPSRIRDGNLYYARLINGRDDDGNRTAGQEIRFSGEPSDRVQWGDRIMLQKQGGSVGNYVYVSLDHDYYTRDDVAPRGKGNPKAQNLPVHLRNVVDGSGHPAVDSNGDYTTKVARFEYKYINHDNTLYSLARGEAGSNSTDLSNYIPSANTERLTLIYTDTTNNADGVIAGDTRTVSSDLYTLSNLQAILDELLHQYCIPLDFWRLATSQTYISKRDYWSDCRQFLNVPMPSGFRHRITRNWALVDNEEIITSRPLEFEDGKRFSFGDNSKLALVA